MKKNLLLTTLLTAMLCACDNNLQSVPSNEQALFTSSDKALEQSYTWARNMAYSYAHTDHDPVGYWYEAALPNREAFCMRDVSHQSIGAHILGLRAHNKNMMMRFVENITEQKDWCSYWEINRYNKPAPADYDNDSTFWYNLPANFDVTQACLRLYEWTADEDYISDEMFVNFYEKSLNEYVERWNLKPENAFKRERYMNKAANFSYNNSFHVCRGLSSYAETFPGITMSIDLLSSMYAANKAYSQMLKMSNRPDSKEYARRAEAYQQIIEEKFWDADSVRYNTFWTQDKVFRRGEGVPFILWFDVTNNVERKRATVADILADEWNVENLSAFPVILYRNGYSEDAYRLTLQLPTMRRSEYPEVSYGVVEGIIAGAMGIEPKMSENMIATCSRLKRGTTAEVKNVPLADGYISLKHEDDMSEIINNTTRTLIWVVSFVGDCSTIEVNGKSYPAEERKDTFGNVISSCKVKLGAGKSLQAVAKY